MNDNLVPYQDLSPGTPGNLDIRVVRLTNHFVTVTTTHPSAYTHEVLLEWNYDYVGPAVLDQLTDMWFLTYKRQS